MVTAPPLRRPVFSVTRGAPSLVSRSPVSLNRTPCSFAAGARLELALTILRAFADQYPMNHRQLLACLAAMLFALPAASEDGYDLWLRYRPQPQGQVREVVAGAVSPTLEAAQSELVRGLSGLGGAPVPVVSSPGQSGALLFGTPRGSPLVAG